MTGPARALKIFFGALFASRVGRFNDARTSSSVAHVLAVAGLALFSALGCQRIPPGEDAIDAVELEGIPSLSQQEIEEGLSTRGTPKLFGLFRGVYEYETYDPSALAKDLERIERQLRRRGFYEAKVRAARLVRTEEDHVRVEIVVDAGQRVFIGALQTEGLAALPFDAAEKATRAIQLKRSDPFDEDDYEKAQLDVANALADVGYAFVRVNGEAQVDLSEHRADVMLRVTPGKRAVYGDVTIEGLVEVPEGPLRDALQLEKGDQYSRSELEQARSALFQLGAFSKVDIVPVTDEPDSGVVPIRVRVEEAPLRSVLAGFGGQLDVLRLAATGRVGWTHRNFFGGLRKFSVSTRPGVTLFPLRVDYIFDSNGKFAGVERWLPENALTVRFEQPSLFEGRTRGFVESNYKIYPLLYPLPVDANASTERIVGYHEITQSVGVERTFFGHYMPVSLSLNWRANLPFEYQGTRIDGLDNVVVSYPELLTAFDFRDNPIQPTRGFYLSNSFQIATQALGGQLNDVRLRPEARGFINLDNARKVILAGRVTFGLVFPQNYGDALIDSTGVNTERAAVIRDQHRLLFRAFYSGGPDSNRGYPFQRVGPQGPIGFLTPPGVDCEATPDDSACLRPLGGFSMWEASLEIRWKFADPWGLVAFIDASDVSSKVATFGLQAPHISVGPGLRYNSPIGPVRLDVGWRVPGLQKLAPEPGERLDVSEVPPYLNENWWDAFALHILIGESF